MENMLNLKSLWDSPRLVQKPKSAIQEIRLQILGMQLETLTVKPGSQQHIKDITQEAMDAVDQLFNNARNMSNPILRGLREKSANTRDDPVLFIKAMLALWYISSVPFIARDDTAAEASPLDQDIAKYGNLGLMAMLLTAENWVSPGDSRLRAATLVANSATSIIFAAHLLGHTCARQPWEDALNQTSNSDCVQSFLRCTWRVARSGNIFYPGIEFGASGEEVKLDKDTKRLLVRVGRNDWSKPYYWHPCKTVPGSPWNKFLKNKKQSVFGGNPAAIPLESRCIMHRFPSTAVQLAETFEDYYAELRGRFDQAGRPRKIVWGPLLNKQFHRLAESTALGYPDIILDEEESSECYDARQEYLETIPMMKRPISDLRGHTTLPFLTSVANALRFRVEPEDIESDLWLLAFGGTEDGDVYN